MCLVSPGRQLHLIVGTIDQVFPQVPVSLVIIEFLAIAWPAAGSKPSRSSHSPTTAEAAEVVAATRTRNPRLHR